MIGILTSKRWRYNWEIVDKFELLVDDWFRVVPLGVSLNETVLAGLTDPVVTIIDIIGLSKNGISQKNPMVLAGFSVFFSASNCTGWWFQTFGLFSISYMGGHPSHWLSYFSRWLLHHQPVQYFGKKRQNCGEQEMMIIEWISLGFSDGFSP